MTLRLIATDIDGTLLRTGEEPTPTVLEALQHASDAGVKVVLVTGRPPRMALAAVRSVPMADALICANGALLMQGDGWPIRAAATIAQPRVSQVLRWAAIRYPAGRCAGESPDGPVGTGLPEDRWGALDNPEHVAKIAGAPHLIKVLISASGENPDHMVRECVGEFGGAVVPSHSNSDGHMMEVAAPGVTKASRLAELAESWGIEAAQVLAVGDMPNDIPMLQWAGMACAMGDGHPDVKAVADHVVADVDADGLAQAVAISMNVQR